MSAYTYAYTFFQLPYGVIAVSVMSAVTPSLSARWAEGDIVAFRHRMAFGLRSILVIDHPLGRGHDHPRPPADRPGPGPRGRDARPRPSLTAAALAMFALGLPGFCTFLYMVRVLQSMQDTRTAFRIYLVENAINIVLGVALVGPLGVRGLALSVSIAYTVAALIALSVVARKDEGLGGQDLTTPMSRVLVATAVMAVATVLAVNVSGATSGLALLGRVASAPWWSAWLAFVGTTVVLGVAPGPPRDRGPTGRPDGRAARSHRASGDGPGGRLRHRRSRRHPASRAAHHLHPAHHPGRTRAPGAAHGDRRGGGRRRPIDHPPPLPFRGRLGHGTDEAPVRHLRPVPGGRGTPTGDPGRWPDRRRDAGGRSRGARCPRTKRRDPMARIRVVTDSACDLSAEVAAELGITLVPLSIRFGDEEFVDGRDLTTEEFWARCKASAVLPETAAPSPGAFQEAFLAAADDGYDGVLSLSLSAGVSATYQAAVAAAKSVADRIEVRAVDTRSMTMGLGLMVIDVAELAADGADLDALEARARELIPRTLGLRGRREPRAPGEGRPDRWGPGAARLAAVHQAGGHPGRRRGGRGVQAAHPAAGRSSTWPTRPCGVAAAESDRHRRRRGHRHRRLPGTADRREDRAPARGQPTRTGRRDPHRARNHRRLHDHR